MLPQLTQNFAFPPTSTNDLNDEEVFSILSFHPVKVLLIAITGNIAPLVLVATMNSKFLLIILYSCLSTRAFVEVTERYSMVFCYSS